MSVILGVAGASRNAALAVCRDGRVGVCEHERIARPRPRLFGRGTCRKKPSIRCWRWVRAASRRSELYAIAEESIHLPPECPVEAIDHHHAHAATAFYSSPFSEATILVCDRRGSPELTIWRGDGSSIRREPFEWQGPGVATL